MLFVYFLLAFVYCEDEIRVTLNVFSGTSDPVWYLRGLQATQLISKFHDSILQLPAADDPSVMRPIPWYRMGYHGFELEINSEKAASVVGKRLAVYNYHDFEWELLFSGEPKLSPSVIEHVRSEITRVTKLDMKNQLSGGGTVSSTIPIVGDTVRGPDDKTVYNPQTDCNGYFVKYQSKNNCYNYGNDVATQTFAQPGRGSGQKWSKNTCDNMRAAAERDGLVWNGTALPKKKPEIGHFVALFIWPNTNFHWIRMDSDPAGYWSHKPGGSPVRDVDDNKRKITDPSKSDFSPWTQFCGYMLSVPSKVNIN